MNLDIKDTKNQENPIYKTSSGNINWTKYFFLLIAALIVFVWGNRVFDDNRDIFYYADGETIQHRGNYNEVGQGVGKHTSYRKDGTKKYEQHFDEKGKLNGRYTTWFENGQIRWTQEYRNDKKHGDYFKYDISGNIIIHEVYNEGMLVEKTK